MGFRMKFGVTPVMSTAGNQGAHGASLVGAEFGYKLFQGEVFTGLEYRMFRDTQRDRTRFGVGYGTNGTLGQITLSGPDGYGNVVSTGAYDSADLRTNKLEGLSWSLGYRRPLLGSLEAHGGLNLAFMRSVQYVTGIINVVDNRQAQTVTVLGTENMYFDVHATSARLGAFGGVRYSINESCFCEVNASTIGFTDANYVPFSYTGKPPATLKEDHTKVMLEFNLGIRL